MICLRQNAHGSEHIRLGSSIDDRSYRLDACDRPGLLYRSPEAKFKVRPNLTDGMTTQRTSVRATATTEGSFVTAETLCMFQMLSDRNGQPAIPWVRKLCCHKRESTLSLSTTIETLNAIGHRGDWSSYIGNLLWDLVMSELIKASAFPGLDYRPYNLR